jgi:hypothetical protein
MADNIKKVKQAILDKNPCVENRSLGIGGQR